MLGESESLLYQNIDQLKRVFDLKFELEQQQLSTNSINSSKALQNNSAARQAYLKVLQDAEKSLSKSLSLVWLAQAIVEIDQKSTQEALDRF